MKKLKIKSLFVNHIEKMVFGLFAFIVLVVLYRTTWGSYPKSPDELMADVTKVKDSINAPENVWPDQAQFKVVDFSDKARQLFSPISVDRYYFSTPLYYPLNQVDEPRREPIFEPVQALIAKATLVTLSVRAEPEPEKSTEPTKVAAAEPEAAAEDSEFKSRINSPGGNPAIPNTAVANTPQTEGGIKANLFGGNNRRPRDDAEETIIRTYTAPTNTGTLLSAGNTSRGVPVVAVRGVFPLQQQLKNYRQALHVSEVEAAAAFEIADFILERQTAKQGPDPWKDAEWKVVKIDRAEEILLDASDIDREDPVPLAMKDPVVTMELPLRLIGIWDEYATHPRIKHELLKKDELDRQNQVVDSLDQTATESNISGASKKKRGLAGIQPNVKNVAQTIRANDQYSKRMSTFLRKRMDIVDNADNAGNVIGNREIGRLLDNRTSILFRYLDFDVLPGFAYRYRVRLKVANPNFEIPAELRGGADPNIIQGAERDTPWSNVSNATEVPKTMEYFLESVLRDPYREEKYKISEANPVAQLSIFDWDSKHGTYIMSTALNIAGIGSYVGDEKKEEEKKKEPPKKQDRRDENRPGFRDRDDKKEKKTAEDKNKLVVLDLSQGGLVKKLHHFSTLDVLVDVEGDVEVDPDQHPELTFLKKEKSKSARVELLEEALISTSLGELKVLDAVNQSASEKSEKDRLTDRVARERRSFKEVVVEDKDKFNDDLSPNARRKNRSTLRNFSRQGGRGGGRGGFGGGGRGGDR